MRTFVLAAFAVLALLFAGMGVLTLGRVREAQQKSRTLVGNMLASIELVSAMDHDVDRERLLLDEHIFEKGDEPMRELETEMAAVESHFRVAAKAYEPAVTLPGERPAWDKLQHDVAAIRGPVLHVLALSRENRDPEAYEARERLTAPFAVIDQDAQSLIAINRAAADGTLAELSSLQRTSAWSIVTMAAVGFGLTIVAGFAVARIAQSRETGLRGHSAALEMRNRDLDAFAGRVAHDLRGPLTTVSFAAGSLEQRAPGEQGTVTILQRAVGRMERLIEDLLALSRIGVPEPDCVCDPAGAAAEVQEDMATRLRGDDAGVSVHVESAPVRCTAGLLRQALFNLADNAVKYRRRDVRLELDIDGHRVGDRYELRVRDSGLGMSPEQARRAFDPFYRALQVRDTPGTGLGLSIVKRVAESTGGSVRVDSQPGRGSLFVITLPVAEPTRPS